MIHSILDLRTTPSGVKDTSFKSHPPPFKTIELQIGVPGELLDFALQVLQFGLCWL